MNHVAAFNVLAAASLRVIPRPSGERWKLAAWVIVWIGAATVRFREVLAYRAVTGLRG